MTQLFSGKKVLITGGLGFIWVESGTSIGQSGSGGDPVGQSDG